MRQVGRRWDELCAVVTSRFDVQGVGQPLKVQTWNPGQGTRLRGKVTPFSQQDREARQKALITDLCIDGVLCHLLEGLTWQCGPHLKHTGTGAV